MHDLFVGSTSSSSSLTFIQQFRALASSTMTTSTSQIVEVIEYLKKKDEVTRQTIALMELVEVTIQKSTSALETIEKKKAELKMLEVELQKL